MSFEFILVPNSTNGVDFDTLMNTSEWIHIGQSMGIYWAVDWSLIVKRYESLSRSAKQSLERKRCYCLFVMSVLPSTFARQ